MPTIARTLVGATVALTFALTGCAALPSAEVIAAAAKKATTKKKPATPKAREVSLLVTGPADLAKDGLIAGTGGASLFKGGQIVAAGGGNLVAAGAGNLVAAGAGNLVAAGAGNLRLAPGFSLLASTTKFPMVNGAGVQLVTLEGEPVGDPIAVDGDGHATLKGVPDGKPLTALAAFQIGEKVYRLAVVVPTGKLAGSLMADPINTMVEARVRDILGPDGKASALTGEKLARVWTICHDAGVTVKPEVLEARDPEASRAALNAVWQEAIDANVTSAEQKQEIKDFMAALKKAIEAKKAS